MQACRPAALGYNEFTGDQKTKTAINYRDPSAVLQPKWNANAGGQYAFRFGGGASITPRVDWSFQSCRTNGTVSLPQRNPDDHNGAYGLSFAVLNALDKFYWQQGHGHHACRRAFHRPGGNAGPAARVDVHGVEAVRLAATGGGRSGALRCRSRAGSS